MPKKPRNPRIGISLSQWLAEDGLTEDVNAIVQKRAIATQLRAEMARRKLSEAEMARRMGTSRAQVRRVLDPDNESATIVVLAKAAHAVGMELAIGLRKAPRKAPAASRAATR